MVGIRVRKVLGSKVRHQDDRRTPWRKLGDDILGTYRDTGVNLYDRSQYKVFDEVNFVRLHPKDPDACGSTKFDVELNFLYDPDAEEPLVIPNVTYLHVHDPDICMEIREGKIVQFSLVGGEGEFRVSLDAEGPHQCVYLIT